MPLQAREVVAGQSACCVFYRLVKQNVGELSPCAFAGLLGVQVGQPVSVKGSECTGVGTVPEQNFLSPDAHVGFMASLCLEEASVIWSSSKRVPPLCVSEKRVA